MLKRLTIYIHIYLTIYREGTDYEVCTCYYFDIKNVGKSCREVLCNCDI